MADKENTETEYIYRRWVTDRSGKRIYPKNALAFRFPRRRRKHPKTPPK